MSGVISKFFILSNWSLCLSFNQFHYSLGFYRISFLNSGGVILTNLLFFLKIV